MNAFLKTYRLALTPLSPIHIGCGEDFEPTNYVIDEGVLYGFDPSRAVLSDLQKAKLTDASNRASLLAIQHFFKDNASIFKAQADVLMPVSAGVAKIYEQRIGRAANVDSAGNTVFNQLFIERNSYTGYQSLPYIPGSSFKGAIRTAIVDHLNNGAPARNDEKDRRGVAKSEVVEKRLFKGDFATSPLRLLKITDLMPAANREPARRILFAVNLKKKQVIKDGHELQPKGIAARKECILHGQYRAFVADAVLPSLGKHEDSKGTPAMQLRPTDLRQVAQQSNTYNQIRLREELSLLAGRGMVNPAWKQSLERLLEGELGKRLTAGEAFLIRLGRYGGAESKTLSGNGVAQIKIMRGKGQPPVIQSTTKTVWLAAENEHEQKHLLPFGWAVVEIDSKDDDLPQLKAWCDEQSKGRPDMAQLRQQFDAVKQAALEQKAEQAALAVQKLAAKKAEELASLKRAEALASMSAQGRLIESLRQQCEDWASKMPPHGNFKHQEANIAKAGRFQDASRLVSQALAGVDWTAADKQSLADMIEACLPKVVAPFGKDERKKLKLAALRGQS